MIVTSFKKRRLFGKSESLLSLAFADIDFCLDFYLEVKIKTLIVISPPLFTRHGVHGDENILYLCVLCVSVVKSFPKSLVLLNVTQTVSLRLLAQSNRLCYTA